MNIDLKVRLFNALTDARANTVKLLNQKHYCKSLKEVYEDEITEIDELKRLVGKLNEKIPGIKKPPELDCN